VTTEFDRTACVVRFLESLSPKVIAYVTESEVDHESEAGQAWCADIRDRLVIDFRHGNVNESDLWGHARQVADGAKPREKADELRLFVVLAGATMRLHASDVSFGQARDVREVMRVAIHEVQTVAAQRLLSLAVDTANEAEEAHISAELDAEESAGDVALV